MTDKKAPLFQMVPISKLQISEQNVRKERDTEQITELSQSIEQEGILQPLLVRPENTHYGIIIGSRRFTAAKKANIKEVPVTIREIEDEDARIISLAENIQRGDLQPIEISRAIVTSLEGKPHGAIIKLADRLGKRNQYISEMVSISRLAGKLEDVGIKIKINPSEQEMEQHKALGIKSAVKVARVFRKPKPKVAEVITKEPDKDIEVATAVTNVKQKYIDTVLDEFEKYPEDNINVIIEEVESGIRSGGHARDYTGTRGSKGIDYHHYELQITEHTAELAHYLSNIFYMPKPTDDVQVDFIMKSREFRKTLVSELEPRIRTSMYNDLNYLSGLIEETMDEIKEQDKN